MRQVDFVVEWEKEIWLVEVKDPVSTPDATRRTEVRRFRSNLLMRPLRLRDALKVSNMREMLEGIEKELLHNALGRKARDSFLYLHLKNTYPGKSVKFLVLYTEDGSDSRMLTSATKSLKNACVFGGPFKRGWAIPYLQDVQIFNPGACYTLQFQFVASLLRVPYLTLPDPIPKKAFYNKQHS